ncbi:MAG: Transglutaminase-like domain protein [Labilithrix sp.]|nr:Transglutaminase-like domain protein [Labilithrix sp.]
MSSSTVDPSFLAPQAFVDSAHPAIVAFARETCGDARTTAEKASLLFRAVRERLRYDPYTLSTDPDDYRASRLLEKARSYCIPKAVLLAAAARAAGIPARLGFADVKNHLSSKKLLDMLGTDLFAFHGYVELWIDGRPIKVTPAFNASLCERFGVPPLDLDPVTPQDALLQPIDGQGRKYMEYLADRGLYLDLPFDEIMRTFAELYGGIGAGRGTIPDHDEAFHGPAQ